METDAREDRLRERDAQIEHTEDAFLRREGARRDKDKEKKQVLLRLTPSLWDKIAVWAEDDFRSINGQIEFILSEAVKNRFRQGG